jgi:hypothetical protein
VESRKPSYWETPAGKKELATLEKMDYGKLSAGNLYRNQLRWPDPAKEASDPLGDKHFLDYDKPLIEQPEVLAKLKESGLLEKSMKQGGFYQQDIPSGLFKGEHMLGMNGSRGRYGNPLDSQELYQAGIPGIRYLDEEASSAGAGTHNYVTFDDSLVNILERNGQPVTAPQPGLLGKMVAPQDEALRVAQALPDNAPMTKLYVSMGGQRFPADNMLDAARKYDMYREQANAGASMLPPVDIVDEAGNVLANFSYNGRLWKGERGAAERIEIDPANWDDR